MSEITAPQIALNGKSYRAPAPKTKFWRQTIRFNEKKPNIATEEGFDQAVQFIADVFQSPDVTPQSIEEGLEMSEFFAVFTSVNEWIQALSMGKMRQLPNAPAPAAKGEA